MERGKSKLQNILEDGLGRDLMNAGRFCFSCEQIFANRKCLEEHFCSAASHICSCGTEFAEYKEMLDHSTTHEPGYQVLDHGTIKKRRIEKRIAEEQQLKRIQTGERKLGVPAYGNLKTNQVMPGIPNKEQGAAPVGGKTGGDMDDDCFIVESGPDKPAEMIYQVTSSVPITS
ncbi:hypothetical protein PBY51_017888 [Eleginops maclovinus]|uniref:Uncharacterized protein n=1 Tax=Eleginops maclovinus TaxID=56733 RepID=A0AAN8AJQ5_ELEMC|nr:hypothetical protein PBY51_017888 [Eleginops maclovinus]